MALGLWGFGTRCCAASQDRTGIWRLPDLKIGVLYFVFGTERIDGLPFITHFARWMQDSAFADTSGTATTEVYMK